MCLEAFCERLFRQNELAIKLGLTAISEAIVREQLAPTYPHILVGGTNGKGQVCAMLSNGLSAFGCLPGLFTSPHLCRFSERIRVSGRVIDDETLLTVGWDVLNRYGEKESSSGLCLSYFECCLMMALKAFSSSGVDFGVFEVGLGGRLDATNALEPCLSVVTSIGHDHEAYLGHEIADIAHEKAGIMRKGCPLIIGRSAQEALIKEATDRVCSDVLALGRDFDWRENDDKTIDFVSPHMTVEMRGASELAAFQRDNAAIAFATLIKLDAMGMVSGDIKAVLSDLIIRSPWVGRLWPVSADVAKAYGVGRIILDGAHNREAVTALCHAIAQNPQRKRALICNSSRDKAIESIGEIFLSQFEGHQIFVPSAQNKRLCTPLEYCQRAALSSTQACKSLLEALKRASHEVGADGDVYIAGSLYLVGEAIAELGQTDALLSIDKIRGSDDVDAV